MSTTAVVEGAGVSKFGPWIMVHGKYLNPSKFAKIDLSVVKKGDTIEFDADGKYIKSFKVLGEGASFPTASGPAYSAGPSVPSNKDEQIARSTAVKSVLGSVLLNEQFKTKDISEVVADCKAIIEEMTRYILTGSFVEKE